MKKCLFALIVIALSVACAKEKGMDTVEDKTVDNKTENTAQAGEIVTISAILPEDLLTKVTFEPTITGGKPTAMALAWKEGDKIRIFDHSDHTQYEDFTLDPACDGKTKGFFSGETTKISAATAFDVEIVNDAVVIGSQTQKEDGNTEHLKYYAPIENIADYSSLTFTNISNILAITAKMPSSEVAAAIKTIEIKASDNDFFDTGVNTLTITLTTKGDAGDDGILHLFANLPQENKATADGTSLLVHFNAPETAHTVYTRYIELGASNFTAGKLNAININATNSASYANASTISIGESTNPYLIGDKYQLQAISLSTTKQYYKLVDDIDLDGVSWTSLNAAGTNVIDLDGNGKTISHLNKPLFDDLNGKVINLTIEDAVMDGGSSITGILANTIKTAASTVTNVDVVGTITTPSYSSSITATAFVGGLIGQIDAGSTNITDCDVSNTNVSGTLAGGVVGFANALVTMSGCTYSGGTVSASARYCGGMLGSTGNFSSNISDCHVENATITNSVASDARTGGFVGQLQSGVTVKGCTVGTSTQPVTISLTADPKTATPTFNTGGFAGTLYGTVTDNAGTRNKVFVVITCANTKLSAQVNLGGFAGYHQGTAQYCDATVTMSSLTGRYIGGFIGRMVNGTVEHCTSSGAVRGSADANDNDGNVSSSFTGGFVGNAEKGTITDCIADVTVTKQTSGNVFGGFAGCAGVNNLSITKCSSVHDISINANYVGGFLGEINTAAGYTATISKCWSTGNVTSSSAQCGGFIGHVAANATGTVNISDCYETGTVTVSNQRVGGLIGQINSGAVTISRCYATSTINGTFAQGGLIGFMNSTATIEDCAAWNTSITAGSIGNGNWSTGAIIGVAWPRATLTNNYRKQGISVKAYWGNVTGYTKLLADDYDHPDVSSTSPLIVVDKTDGSTLKATTATSAASGQDNYPLYAYHGKHSTTSRLSTLASTTLGWDDSVWDFTDDLPTLK